MKINKKKNIVSAIYILLSTCTILIGLILLGSNWKELMNTIEINSNKKLKEENKSVIEETNSKNTINVVYGDIDEDGKISSSDSVILARYLEKGEKLTEQAKKNADINADNKVNELDKVLLSGVLAGIYEHDITTPLTNYIIYGDIDEDGKISSSDSVILARYLEKGDKLTKQAKKNADINADNKVNELDKVLLSGVLAGIYEHDITTSLTNYIIYGDTNEDGKITTKDATKLLKFINEDTQITEQAKKNADINADNKINELDLILLMGVITRQYNHDLITPLTNYIIYGDIDEDGKITSSDSVILAMYLEKGEKLTEQAKKNADINADNKVNELDKVLLSGVLAGIYEHDITTPLTNYIIYGDIDEDGKISSSDSVILARYLEKGEKLTEQAKKNADINADNKINQLDKVLLSGILAGIYEHEITTPLTNYIIYGDMNEDGKITAADGTRLRKYLNGEVKLTEQTNKNADINADDKINELDLILLIGVLSKQYNHELTTPLTNYIVYGDIDEDGKITSSDSVILARYLEKGEKLTEQAKKNADINGDGTITKEDSTLLGEFLVDLHKDTLPYKPVK